MKKYFILFTLAIVSIFVQAKTIVWTNDPAHSRLGFVVSHLTISQIEGRFSDFSAKVTTTKPDYSDAKIVVTAKVASINTDVEARDNDLRSSNFFDAAKYPTLTFVSTGIKKISANKGYIYGNLTFHGITKPIRLNVVFFGKLISPLSKKLTAGFQVTGVVKRSDYKLGLMDPPALVGENVKIVANVEFSPKD